MSEDTTAADAATLLLGLEGLAVERVEPAPDGGRVVWVVTAEETARGCPSCGVVSRHVKDVVRTRPRDLPCGAGGLALVWVKRRWYCRERLCARTSFTESLPVVPARARLTTRLRAEAGDRVKDGACATVLACARALGLSWPTVMDALWEQAAELVDGPAAPVEVLGIDEVRRGRPRWRAAQTPGDGMLATSAPAAAVSGPATSTSVNLEPVEPQPVERQPDTPPVRVGGETAKARVQADRWHVGFTDIAGGQGMLGQVEGRTGDDVAYWLASQPAAWRDRIRYVTIDMCTIFVSAVRRVLPHARLVVDHFHMVKLAGDMVAEVRRRVTTTLRGRRGRDSDPEWKIRNLLGRNREALSPKAFAKLWNTLVELGEPGATILKAWIAKDKLRQLLALAGTHPARSVISHRLYRFYTWCADAGIPELARLADTISTWWPCIEAFLETKITNAKSEGFNRVVKLDARNAFGYRNPANQRLRTRCATTRRARGCLDPG